MNLHSEQIDQLATALAKAQSEFLVAGKNQKNPFFKSSYADFEAIINASRPALTKYGLSVIQSPFEEDGNSYLVTVLMHASGQWIKSKSRHNPLKSDIQSLSSYNTYLKRMCYTSLIGVVVGEDDDGEAAVSHTRSPKITTYQEARILNLPEEGIKEILEFFKVNNVLSLSQDDYKKIAKKYNWAD